LTQELGVLLVGHGGPRLIGKVSNGKRPLVKVKAAALREKPARGCLPHSRRIALRGAPLDRRRAPSRLVAFWLRRGPPPYVGTSPPPQTV
jgi:hypothetical protein